MLLSTIRLANPYKDYTEFDILPVLKHREDVKYKLLEIPRVNALIHYQYQLRIVFNLKDVFRKERR